MIYLFTGFIFIFLLCRFVLPLPLSPRQKMAAGALLFVLSQQNAFIRSFSVSMASPEVAPSLLVFMGASTAALLFLAILVLLRDIVSLILLAGRRINKRMNPVFSPGRRGILLAGLSLAPAVYSVNQALATPRIRSLEARLPGLPGDLDGLTLVHVSDTHISRLFQRDWVSALVEKINALNPDIIALTGDIVDGLPLQRMESMTPLRALRARWGVFACAGNHEYYADYERWMRVFPSLGINMLLNRHEVLRLNGQEVVIAGITDIAAQRYGLPLPDSAAALAGAPEKALRIMLSHRPSEADDCARAGIDLQLSGHTHGGQIVGINQVVAEFNRGYLHGWYQVDNMMLYVTSGAGLWNGFPVRLGVASEIAAITLRGAA
ncbi:MAG: metallophosphoesterase [Desulfarculales bacterium]|jgi:predicted MPP superfamily phosphohydrolase|nr:metallophosphoesterase [Desulfarculales bacterium]